MAVQSELAALYEKLDRCLQEDNLFATQAKQKKSPKHATLHRIATSTKLRAMALFTNHLNSVPVDKDVELQRALAKLREERAEKAKFDTSLSSLGSNKKTKCRIQEVVELQREIRFLEREATHRVSITPEKTVPESHHSSTVSKFRQVARRASVEERRARAASELKAEVALQLKAGQLSQTRHLSALEQARKATQEAETYEQQYQEMRKKLRDEVILEVFGSTLLTSSYALPEAVEQQASINPEHDFSEKAFCCLSEPYEEGISLLDQLVETCQQNGLWEKVVIDASTGLEHMASAFHDYLKAQKRLGSEDQLSVSSGHRLSDGVSSQKAVEACAEDETLVSSQSCHSPGKDEPPVIPIKSTEVSPEGKRWGDNWREELALLEAEEQQEIENRRRANEKFALLTVSRTMDSTPQNLPQEEPQKSNEPCAKELPRTPIDVDENEFKEESEAPVAEKEIEQVEEEKQLNTPRSLGVVERQLTLTEELQAQIETNQLKLAELERRRVKRRGNVTNIPSS